MGLLSYWGRIAGGGGISPLLGALYLTPLDRLMVSEEKRRGIRYQRFMDDFVIFAPTCPPAS